MCSVCSEDIAYNLVIKHESLDTESAFLLDRLGLDRGGWDVDTSPDISPEVHNNAILNTNLTHMFTFQMRERYFNLLTPDEVWRLYKYYQLDFELFGYSLDDNDLINKVKK